MTLCIAANVRFPLSDAIVCCFDFRIETQAAGSNTGYKFRKISNEWAAMLSGYTSKADRLLDIFVQEFSKQEPEQLNATVAIREVVAKYRLELVDEYIQSTLSMPYQEFLTKKPALPEPLFTQIAQEVLQIRQGCELLLFSVKFKMPFFWVVSSDGLVDQQRNFGAIGSGAENAIAWLHFREQSSFNQLDRTILCVYEAKRFAEHAPGVGKTTRLMVIQDEKLRVLVKMKDADRVWKKYGPRVLPERSSSPFLPYSGFSEHSWDEIKA